MAKFKTANEIFEERKFKTANEIFEERKFKTANEIFEERGNQYKNENILNTNPNKELTAEDIFRSRGGQLQKEDDSNSIKGVLDKIVTPKTDYNLITQQQQDYARTQEQNEALKKRALFSPTQTMSNIPEIITTPKPIESHITIPAPLTEGQKIMQRGDTIEQYNPSFGQKVWNFFGDVKDGFVAGTKAFGDKLVQPLDRFTTKVMWNDFTDNFSKTPDAWKPKDVLKSYQERDIENKLKPFQNDPNYDAIYAQEVAKQRQSNITQADNERMRDFLGKGYNWTPEGKTNINIGKAVGGMVGDVVNFGVYTALTRNPITGAAMAGWTDSYGQGGSYEDMAKSAGSNALFMAVLGPVSKIFEGVGATLLKKTPDVLKNSLVANIANKVIADGIGGGAGTIAASQVYNPGEMPEWEDILKGAAFNVVFSGLPASIKMVKDSKVLGNTLGRNSEILYKDIDTMYRQANKTSEPLQKAQIYDSIVSKIDDSLSALKENRYVGQNKTVSELKDILTYGRDNLESMSNNIKNKTEYSKLPESFSEMQINAQNSPINPLSIVEGQNILPNENISLKTQNNNQNILNNNNVLPTENIQQQIGNNLNIPEPTQPKPETNVAKEISNVNIDNNQIADVGNMIENGKLENNQFSDVMEMVNQNTVSEINNQTLEPIKQENILKEENKIKEIINPTEEISTPKKVKKFEDIKNVEDLPNDIEGLKEYISKSEEVQKNESKYKDIDVDFKLNLQLFAEAKKKLETLTSKFYTNTLSNANFMTDSEKANIDASKFEYQRKSEAETIKDAKESLKNNKPFKIKELKDKETYNDVDTESAMMIAEDYLKEARKSGDYSKVNDWFATIRPKFTEGGRGIQALAKWSRDKSPEGTLLEAQRIVDRVEEDIKKTNPKKIEKVDKESKDYNDAVSKAEKEAVSQISNDIKNNLNNIISNKKETPPNKEELSPEEILAKRIIKTTKNKDNPKEKDAIAKMIDELYTKFKETLPEGEAKKITPNKIAEVSKAIQERRISGEVWTKAKTIVMKEFEGNDEAISTLEDYFGKGTKPPFAEKTIDEAVTQALKEKGIEIGNLIKKYYDEGYGKRLEVVEYIKKESGLNEEDANILADYVQKNLKEKIKNYSEKYLVNLFKEKIKSEVPKTSKVLADIEKLSNVGGFINEKYSQKVLEKLSPQLQKLIKESGIKMNELVKDGIKETEFQKDKFLFNLMGKIEVNEIDAQVIASEAESVFDNMAQESRTKILNKIFETKKGREPKKVFEKVMELINLDAYSDQNIRNIIKEKENIPVLDNQDIKNILDGMEKVKNLKEGSYEQRMEFSKVKRIMADKIPATTREKGLGLQRMSLLSALKSYIRNPLGNIVLSTFENIKDSPASMVDFLTSKALNSERTTLNMPIAKLQAQKEGFKKGLEEWLKDIKYNVDTSPSRSSMELPNKTLYSKNTTTGQTLNAVHDFVSKALQLGDRPFYEAAYNLRVKELQKIKNTEEITDYIKEQASLYALERVFQNDSLLAEKTKKIKDGLGIIGDVTIPFSQTPANIFDKLLDYTPIGLGKGLYELGKVKSGTFNQKVFVDRIGRALTGIGIAVLGYILASNDMVTGGPNKNPTVRDFEKTIGKTPYSFKIGDGYYDFSWIQPIAGAFAVGVDGFYGGKDKKDFITSIAGGLEGAGNSMIKQSLFKGILDLLSNYSSPITGLGKTALNASTQANPTIIKQISQVLDPNVRETYDPNTLEQQKNKLTSGVPFASKTLPPKINEFGEEVKTKGILNILVNPGTYTEYMPTNVQKEILRLYEATGKTTMIPKIADKEITIDKEKYQLSAEQFSKLQKTQGELIKSNLDKTMKNFYSYLSDDDKAKKFKKAIDDAEEKAQKSIEKEVILANRDQRISELEDKIEKLRNSESSDKNLKISATKILINKLKNTR